MVHVHGTWSTNSSSQKEVEMSFFKKKDDTTASYGGVDESSSRTRKGFTVGRVINASIAIDFACILVAGLVVISLIANLHLQLASHPDHDVNTTSHHYCVLYSTCDSNGDGSCTFHYSQSYVCEFCIYTTAVLCGIALTFIVICIVRTILALNIWVTVIAEVAVLSVCVLLSFVVGVSISIGLKVTCDKVNDYYHPAVNGCDQTIPNANGIKFYSWMNSAQGSAWFVFTFLVIALVIFIIRMVIFFRRRKKTPHEDREVLTAEDHPPEDEPAKPI